jgi:hypothetical protein
VLDADWIFAGAQPRPIGTTLGGETRHITDRAGDKMESNNPFIGTWELISWENTCPNGEVTYPYGKHPIGYLLYTEDGYLVAEMMDPNRHQRDASLSIEPAFDQTLPDKA